MKRKKSPQRFRGDARRTAIERELKEDARMYREVLGKEFDRTLRNMSEYLNPEVTPPTNSLSLSLETIIRYTQSLGLSVWVEFVRMGSVREEVVGVFFFSDP